MRMKRRIFLQTAPAIPIGVSFPRHQALAGLRKITRIQALQLKDRNVVRPTAPLR